MTIECIHCGKQFSGTPRRKYCSKRCKIAQHILRQRQYQNKCKHCGKLYYAPKQNKGFCSLKCAQSANRIYKGTIKVCIQCGKQYEPTHKDQSYCSSICVSNSRINPNKLTQRRERESYKRKNDLGYIINYRMRGRMHAALKRNKGGISWQKLVGYSTEDLKSHLQKKFTQGMTWDKFINGEIHIDHIIPVSAFNIKTKNDPDFKRCWSLKNLQPLWAKDNLSKSNKLHAPFQPFLSFVNSHGGETC